MTFLTILQQFNSPSLKIIYYRINKSSGKSLLMQLFLHFNRCIRPVAENFGFPKKVKETIMVPSYNSL